MNLESQTRCHLCGADTLEMIDGFATRVRVTSDVKPWESGGTMAWCRRCGGVQNVLNDRWHTDCRRIYDHYSIYDIGGGSEQKVFDATGKRVKTRSACLVTMLKEQFKLPETGRFLDVGCANGATLRAFGEEFPQWRLTGTDVHDQFRSEVERIPGVERFVCGTLDDVPGTYDAISLIHVLEHVPWPGDFLAGLLKKLTDNGVLIVQVPDCEVSPFMYTVTDHATHFFLPVLSNLISNNGYEVLLASRAVFGKELTVIARRAQAPVARSYLDDTEDTYGFAQEQIDWLSDQVATVKEIATESEGRPLGLFGASIAATWMYHELAGKISFFVDEDPNRVGKSHLGLPILAPRQVPAGSHVYMCIPSEIAANIARRHAALPVRWHVPSPTPLVRMAS